MTVTIKDVAQRAGVSAKTVSRVINGEPHVKSSVRDTVMRIVEEIGYRPNTFARSLSSARTYMLGLFLDEQAWSSYSVEMHRSTLMRCRERRYHLFLEPLDVTAANCLDTFVAALNSVQLEGLILVPPLCRHEPLLAHLEAIGLPYVRVSPGQDRSRSGVVEIDEQKAARDMTEYLIGLGHREIGFVCGTDNHAATSLRRAGFFAAMRDHGLRVNEDWVRPGNFTFRGGFEAGESMLRGAQRPTAIFASNDDSALGVTIAAAKVGISVPYHLSVAGFDDAVPSRTAWPPMTTVRQPIAEIAATAVDILVDAKYRAAPTDPAFCRELRYELVIRGSSAPPYA